MSGEVPDKQKKQQQPIDFPTVFDDGAPASNNSQIEADSPRAKRITRNCGFIALLSALIPILLVMFFINQWQQSIRAAEGPGYTSAQQAIYDKSGVFANEVIKNIGKSIPEFSKSAPGMSAHNGGISGPMMAVGNSGALACVGPDQCAIAESVPHPKPDDKHFCQSALAYAKKLGATMQMSVKQPDGVPIGKSTIKACISIVKVKPAKKVVTFSAEFLFYGKTKDAIPFAVALTHALNPKNYPEPGHYYSVIVGTTLETGKLVPRG